MTNHNNTQLSEPWNREPDPCWSCGGEAEARDDIHVRCIDSKGINCEVMNHWFTRKTWNSRAAVAAPRDTVRDNLQAIIVRCTDGDPSYDWRSIIARLAQEALDSLPSPVSPSLKVEEVAAGEQKQVQCADCSAWFAPDSNHTCRQQVRRNQRSSK